MKNKALEILKNKYFLAILAIIFLGSFLRMYHFSDWLHFELDQSRDAKVIDLAYSEGISNLPLLGPKAAGSFLRLGPIFYYFKYLSALIFGNTPSGIAVIIMIFGILAMPFFYLFSREYFDKKISIGLLLIFSTSLFLVIYSRFSWNPNSLMLFIPLTFYFLLKATKKDEKKRGKWLIFSSISLAITMQMHFLAFVSIPVIFVMYLIIKRPKIKLLFWILSLALILVIYSPAIANDFMTGGDNIKEFQKVAQGKSTKDTHALWEKVVKNIKENSLGHFLIISGQRGEFPKLDLRNEASLAFNQKNKSYFIFGIISGLIYLFGIFLLFKKLLSEKEETKKNFLILNFIWLVIAFGLFIPLSFDISPRFFLIISALPFVFLGLILEFIQEKLSAKKSLFLIFLIIAILTFSNLAKTKQRFSEYSKAPLENFEIEPDRFLKEKTRVTLEQQYLIVNYIENIYSQNKYPVYLNSEPFYRRSLLFHIDNKNIPRDDLRNTTNAKKLYQNGNYFLIFPTNSNIEKKVGEYSNSFNLKDTKNFGTLTLFQLEPKKELVTDIQQDFSQKKNSDDYSGAHKRFTWEELMLDDSEEESD